MSALFSGDVDGPSRPMPHFWEHTIGSGHATLALRADWQAQMRRAHDELGVRHVRFHGLLSDDVGTLIAERAKAAGITTVLFDRGGYIYHGRIAAVAAAARDAGLEF